MEGKVCLYHKFGFCKYKETCRNQHHQEECEALFACKSINTCHTRHPKVCKRFSSEKGCRFESKGCAYHHPDHSKPSVNTDLKEKVEAMEDKMKEMVQKIFNLETELKEMKSIKRKTEIVIKEPEQNIDKSQEKNYIKKYEKDQGESKTKSEPILERMFNCDQCDYKCKKETTLKKHIHTKHTQHICKRCNGKFKTSMELVMHVATEHNGNTRNETTEPKDQTQENTSLMNQTDITEELPDITKCEMCQEKVQESSTLKLHAGKCTLCAILSYGDE